MDHITHIPLSALRESPTNPRRTFSESALEELANSIALQGVMSPIVVRPVTQADIEHEFEIVFGHRRFRAAELAKLETIPAIVRSMSDEQVIRAQLHENMHRADVHPVEEAEAFARLMSEHNVSIETLVNESGKSRSYIYARLKLATMHPAVRAACIDDGLIAETALLVARLPAAVQPEALKRLRDVPSGWISYRGAKQVLQGYCSPLTNNPRVVWDLADESMPGGSCARCPNMACNNPAYTDLSADVCVDKLCMEGKRREMTVRAMNLADAGGRQTVSGEAADRAVYSSHWIEGYTLLSTARDQGLSLPEEVTTWQDVLDGLSPRQREEFQPMLLVSDKLPAGHATVLPDAAMDRLIEVIAPKEPGASSATNAAGPDFSASQAATAQRGDPRADWSTAERVVATNATSGAVLSATLSALGGRGRTLEEMRMALEVHVTQAGDFGPAEQLFGIGAEMKAENPDDVEAWCLARIARMTADEAGAMLIGIAVAELLDVGHFPARETAARAVAVAQYYGVDPAAIAAQAAAEAEERESQTDDARGAGEEQKDNAGPAGDLFEAVAQ